MKLNSLDLNLLLVFDAVLRTASVTLAAEEMGLSQGAMSNALSRLREYFNDQLFVRIHGGMQPTPLALRLASPVQEALQNLRTALEDKRHFDPCTSERCFRICMTEVAQRVVMPRLLTHLRTAAAGIRVATVEMSPEQAQEALVSGDIDLALGYFATFGPNFYAQRLFQERYVVMARRNHPATRDGLTLETFLRVSHIAYLPMAASHHTLEATLDREFAQLGVRRHVAVQMAHSLGLSSVVAGTDLVVTIPSRLGQAFSDMADVELFELPLNVPRIDIKQFWHARFHQDPAIQWLRGQFQQLFQD